MRHVAKLVGVEQYLFEQPKKNCIYTDKVNTLPRVAP